jgi:hypothetical protein
VKGIYVCSNELDNPSPRGDNSGRVKIHWKFLNIFFSRTSEPNSIKLGTNYPWLKGIQVCSNKGSGPLQRGRSSQKCKNGVGSFKNLLQNHWDNFNLTWHKSSLGKGFKVIQMKGIAPFQEEIIRKSENALKFFKTLLF